MGGGNVRMVKGKWRERERVTERERNGWAGDEMMRKTKRGGKQREEQRQGEKGRERERRGAECKMERIKGNREGKGGIDGQRKEREMAKRIDR